LEEDPFLDLDGLALGFFEELFVCEADFSVFTTFFFLVGVPSP
jgi:hypothetical protein